MRNLLARTDRMKKTLGRLLAIVAAAMFVGSLALNILLLKEEEGGVRA